MSILLSTTNVDAWYLWIHDRHHLVLADSHVFGSDIVDIDAEGSWYYSLYEVHPSETTFIDQGGNSIEFCWPEKRPRYWPENQPKVPFEKDTCTNF